MICEVLASIELGTPEIPGLRYIPCVEILTTVLISGHGVF